jgi:hypothetical protein
VFLRVPAVAIVLLAVGASALAPAGATAVAAAHPSPSRAFASTGITASATWEGHDISSASSASRALAISKGDTAAVVYSYAGPSAAAVANATLEVTYLGIVLTTSRDAAHGGSAEINWSFGVLYDALEGLFQLTASLQYANGSTAWSESFFVFAKAPYLLESGAVVVLLVFAVAETYWGLSAIREARQGSKSPPPSSPPASPGGPSSGGSPGSAGPVDSAPAGSAPPSTGGPDGGGGTS